MKSLIELGRLVQTGLPAGIDRDNKPDNGGLEERRRRVAASLFQLAGWVDASREMRHENLSLAELGAAYEELGRGRRWASQDLRDRQITCQQLAALCRAEAGDVPRRALCDALRTARRVWTCWIDACNIDDQNECALRAILLRERDQLQLAIRQLGYT
jgi:hypothetical protein